MLNTYLFNEYFSNLRSELNFKVRESINYASTKIYAQNGLYRRSLDTAFPSSALIIYFFYLQFIKAIKRRKVPILAVYCYLYCISSLIYLRVVKRIIRNKIMNKKFNICSIIHIIIHTILQGADYDVICSG